MVSEKVNERPLRDTSTISSALMSSVVSNWVLRAALVFSVVLNLYLLTFSNTPRSGFGYGSSNMATYNATLAKIEDPLDRLLRGIATSNKTILLTYLNEAWIAPKSMFDLFLESFRIGHKTKRLLRHLLVVSLDDRAHLRCLKVHRNCYYFKFDDQFNLTQEATFMSSNYLEIVWRKIDFMHTILNKGYNFVFTDGDVMWLRNPFHHLKDDSNFQVSSDVFYGDPRSLHNFPNTGFMYVKSDIHTTLFFKIWYSLRFNYKEMKNQDVFNLMKDSGMFKVIGLDVKFLDPTYFNGFCLQRQNISQVCTMHANCCFGLGPKVHDLNLILKDWKNYTSYRNKEKDSWAWKWSAPQQCLTSTFP